MSSASRRHTRTGVRSRSVTRPHVEGLEARFAAGTVIDLFGSSWAGLGVFGQPGEIRPSKVVTDDSAAGQRHAVTLQSRSPVTSLSSAPTAPKRPDGRRSSSAAVSPISSQESAIVLDPRWGGTQGPAEAAWDRMGAPDTPQRGATPTGPLAPRPASAASGAAGNRSGNLSSGTLTAGSGGSAAGGGGVSASASCERRGLGSAPARDGGVLHACVGEDRGAGASVATVAGASAERRGRGRSKRRGESAGNERTRFPHSRRCWPGRPRAFVIFGGRAGSATGDRPGRRRPSPSSKTGTRGIRRSSSWPRPSR